MALRATQRTSFEWSSSDTVDLHLSVPFWAEIADPSTEYRLGIVRHGGLDAPRGHVPKDLKPAYHVHAQRYLEAVGDPTGEEARTLLAWGVRNCGQNLGIVAWQASRRPNILCRPDEPIDRWVYHGLCRLKSGKVSMEAVRFVPAEGGDYSVEIVNETTDAAEIEFVVTGQPLCWDGAIPTPAQHAAVTYDLRHVYHLLWERWQWDRWPEYRHHKAIHDEMMASLMGRLTEPISSRAAALAEIAAREGLVATQHYLHSAIGQRDDGGMVLLITHASLEELGRALRDVHGCRRGVLLDNGGSCGAAYWARKGWSSGAWSRESAPMPKYIGQGSYFRPNGHALLILELHEDFSEPAFEPRARADSPWQ